MAVADKAADFAIDTKADELLTRASRALADLLLSLASKQTKHTTKNGMKLVTEGDIVDSARQLSVMMDKATSPEADIPVEVKESVKQLNKTLLEFISAAAHAK